MRILKVVTDLWRTRRRSRRSLMPLTALHSTREIEHERDRDSSRYRRPRDKSPGTRRNEHDTVVSVADDDPLTPERLGKLILGLEETRCRSTRAGLAALGADLIPADILFALEDYRQASGLSEEEFNARAGLSKGYYTKLFDHHDPNPYVATIAALYRALDHHADGPPPEESLTRPRSSFTSRRTGASSSTPEVVAAVLFLCSRTHAHASSRTYAARRRRTIKIARERPLALPLPANVLTIVAPVIDLCVAQDAIAATRRAAA